tara:strand:- start:5787 stop:6329 length:543 start_codon:yes stop_codon:yes gene_type:complete
MADKSVRRERVEYKNTVKFEKDVTVEGTGVEQVLFSDATTVAVGIGTTNMVFPTIPANALITDFGITITTLIDVTTGGSGTVFNANLGKGGSQTNLVGVTQINGTGVDLAAGATISVSGGAANHAGPSGGTDIATLAFADGALLASTTALTDLTAQVAVVDAVLSNPGAVRAFVKYVVFA